MAVRVEPSDIMAVRVEPSDIMAVRVEPSHIMAALSLSEWTPQMWMPFCCHCGVLGYKRCFTVKVMCCQFGVLGYKYILLASFNINGHLLLKWSPLI